MGHNRTIILINLWDKGGMKHYADALAEAIRQETRVVYVCNYPVTPATNLTHHPVAIGPEMVSPRNLWAALRLGWRLVRLKGAIYMTSDHPMLLLLYPLFAFRRSVLVIHDARSHHGERTAKVLFHKLHLNLFSLMLRRFVVHSEQIAAALPWTIRVRKPTVIPHLHYRSMAQTDTAPLGAGPFRLLFFGRILAYKGLTDLYGAMTRLPQDAFDLTVAGEGRIEETYTGDNQTLINRFITDEEMHRLFDACHAVVLPYRAASQSGVAYMALAYGKPVISTRVGAIPEVIKQDQNGLLIPPGDREALAAAIRAMAVPQTYATLCDGIAKNSADNIDLVRQRVKGVCFD